MLRTTLLVTAMLATATPVFAQAKCVPSGPGAQSLAEYVEQRRPVVMKRKLTNDEKAITKKLVADIRSAIKDKNKAPRVSDIEALAPYGNTGDREIMKTLAEGYLDLDAGDIYFTDPVRYDINGYGRPSVNPETVLAGLWGMQLWLDGDRSREMSRALANCVGTKAWAAYGRNRCGFDATFSENDYDKSVESHAEGKGRLPKEATFTQETLLVPFETEKSRWEKVLASYRKGDDERGNQAWAACWAKRQPQGDYLARWEGSSTVAQQAYRDEQDSKVLRAKWKIEEDAKAWEALNTLRLKSEADGGATVLGWDAQKFADLSFSLGGKYLEPFATKVYLGTPYTVDSYCKAVPGETCNRQRRIVARMEEEKESLAAEARLESELREARWRAAIEDNAPGSTSVRTYDQNGNYQGSSEMSKWQADILAGH